MLPCHDGAKWPKICDMVKKYASGGPPDTNSLRQFIIELQHTLTNSKRFTIEQFNSIFEAIPPSDQNRFRSFAIPQMCRSVLAMRRLFRTAVPALIPGRLGCVTLTAEQCFSLLAAGFLCILPFQKGPPGSRGLAINFFGLFRNTQPNKVQKLQCFVLYFIRMSEIIDKGDRDEMDRPIEFRRLVSQRRRGAEWWGRAEQVLGEVVVKASDDKIEDSNQLQADFANRCLGGGVLSQGCVQEEIRFAISPELVVSRLLMAPLLPLEAAIITGSKRFTAYDGYASSFTCTGLCTDPAPVHPRNKAVHSFVVALDATNFHHADRSVQYGVGNMLRETNKALAAVQFKDVRADSLAFASGNWGCGAFGGDPQLKFLLQWMACSVADRALHYYPFTDPRVKKMADVVQMLRQGQWTVGRLWTFLLDRSADSTLKTKGAFKTLFEHLNQTYAEEEEDIPVPMEEEEALPADQPMDEAELYFSGLGGDLDFGEDELLAGPHLPPDDADMGNYEPPKNNHSDAVMRDTGRDESGMDRQGFDDFLLAHMGGGSSASDDK